jgi:hypothetical protein
MLAKVLKLALRMSQRAPRAIPPVRAPAALPSPARGQRSLPIFLISKRPLQAYKRSGKLGENLGRIPTDLVDGGAMVSTPQVDDAVQLTSDIPDLWLSRGTVGVVRSIWFAPSTVYEVEFEPVGLNCPTRALLLDEQIQAAQEYVGT